MFALPFSKYVYDWKDLALQAQALLGKPKAPRSVQPQVIVH